jgi:hypothetical protein
MIGKDVGLAESSPAGWRSDMIGKTISHNKVLEKFYERDFDEFSYLGRFQMQLRTNGGKTTLAVILLSLCALSLLCAVGTARAHGVDPAWGPEMQITANGLNASGAVGRVLAIDQAGYYHVVYHDMDTWNVFYTRSMNAGSTWIPPVQLSTGTFAASGPVIALGQSGTLHVCWRERVSGTDVRIYYTRFIPGTGWETPRDISGALALECASATLVVDTYDRVHLAWHIGDASLSWPYDPSLAARVYYTRSTDGGGTFETPQQISGSTGYHAAWPRLSLTGTDGDLLAFAWRYNSNDSDWDIYAGVSTDGGASFEECLVSAETSNREWDPEAAVDPYGIIHVTYFNNPGLTASVHYRRSMDGGITWSSEVDLSNHNGTFPSFAYHPATSRLWVMWKDERDRVNPGDRRSDIITRYSDDGGLSWSDHEFVTDLGEIDVRYPSMAVDPQGTPVVQWADLRYGPVNSAMFLKRRDYPVPAVSLAGIVVVTMLILAGAVLALQRLRNRKIART